MKVSTSDRNATLQVLPDCGADICAAGPHLVHTLEEHMDNLAESTITLKAVNGSPIYPMEKIPDIMFELNGRCSSEDIHITNQSRKNYHLMVCGTNARHPT